MRILKSELEFGVKKQRKKQSADWLTVPAVTPQGSFCITMQSCSDRPL